MAQLHFFGSSLRNCAKIFLFLSAFCICTVVNAQSKIQLELIERGKVEAKVSARVHSSSSSHVSHLLLPFKVNATAEIRSADNVDISLLSSGHNFTLLSVLYPAHTDAVVLNILDAVELDARGDTPRVKLELDFNYSGFQSHSSLRSSATVDLVDEFDLEVLLPNSVKEDDLSLSPRAGWVIRLPQIEISSSLNSGNEVYVAFSNTFRDSLWLAQIFVGAVGSTLLMILGGKSLVNRSARTMTLVVVAFITLVGLGLVGYFFSTLLEPLGFLAWVVGVALPWPFLLIACLIFLVRKQTDAEIAGIVQIANNQGNIPAEFVKIKISDSEDSKWSKECTVENQGTYRCFVYCWKKPRKLTISVEDSDFQPASSKQVVVTREDRLQVDPIVLTRKP